MNPKRISDLLNLHLSLWPTQIRELRICPMWVTHVSYSSLPFEPDGGTLLAEIRHFSQHAAEEVQFTRPTVCGALVEPFVGCREKMLKVPR